MFKREMTKLKVKFKNQIYKNLYWDVGILPFLFSFYKHFWAPS